jgi:hypothetical protein
MGTSYVQSRTRHVFTRSARTDKNNSNSISLTKRPDPVTLGPNDKLKLTFQVAEQGTDNGVQPHQTFLRFVDSTTGEEGIQPVKITPSGKAKFELVCCFVTCAAGASLTCGGCDVAPSPLKKKLRTWPSRRTLFRLLARHRCMCPSSSAPSCTAPR